MVIVEIKYRKHHLQITKGLDFKMNHNNLIQIKRYVAVLKGIADDLHV